MTKISCGVIIKDNDGMLIVRPTNHNTWNIPKGIKDENETDMNAAFRETEEETGIDLYELWIAGKIQSLDNMGQFDYYKGKKLVLFNILFNTEDLPATEDMKCDSMFYNEKLGIYQPELSKFKYIPIEDYDNYVNKSLKKVLNKIF